MQRPHIIIGDNYVENVDYKSLPGGKKDIPSRERLAHANLLDAEIANAYASFDAERRSVDINNEDESDGIYLELQLTKVALLSSSTNTKGGVRVMNIKTSDEELYSATVYVPSKNKNWLPKRVRQYSESSLDKKPRNENLINNIQHINAGTIRDLFTSTEDLSKYDSLSDNVTAIYELWFHNEFGEIQTEDIHAKLDRLGIGRTATNLIFEHSIIILVKADKTQLQRLIYAVADLSEIRIYRNPSVLLRPNNYKDDQEWVQLIKETIETKNNPVRIGILDSGVNNDHPLLFPFISDERCHNATLVPSKKDRINHGTLLSGLVLFGDLTDAIYTPEIKTSVLSDLTSVKIMPGRDEETNMPEFYGIVAENSIRMAEEDGATIQCSAITSQGDTNGEPSSWSAAIDKTLYNQGRPTSMLLLAAGNVREIMGVEYPDFNNLSQVEDPGQSWNALTVGAYTDKCIISDPKYQDVSPIAPKHGLSPFSRTSMMWGKGIIKPEILMEGGNAICDGDSLSYSPDEINLVSTSAKHIIHPFDIINATSAATALAARLASKIKYYNPSLTPLSIRALMVHSAEWTEEMKRQNTNEKGGLDTHALLHSCGYGVPIESKAVVSADNCPTFVLESSLRALVEAKSGKYKAGEMQIIELPWPKGILESLGEESVRLKVTLSYYINPAPGSRSRINKYSYPGVNLRFDLINPTENLAEFKRRVSHIPIDGVRKTDNDTKRWEIGIKERNQGSIVSDYICRPASEIASCNVLAIYPIVGWMKNIKYSVDVLVPYSLVVSIETEATDIYTSIPIPVINEVPV